MRTLTNSPVLMNLNQAELNTLALQPQTTETLDIVASAGATRKISAANMWKIHNQRRGISLRKALR